MSDAIRQHTIKYPHARTSTVRYLVAREEMTKRLREEIDTARRVNEFRGSIGYVSWAKAWLAKLRGR